MKISELKTAPGVAVRKRGVEMKRYWELTTQERSQVDADPVLRAAATTTTAALDALDAVARRYDLGATHATTAADFDAACLHYNATSIAFTSAQDEAIARMLAKEGSKGELK